MTDMEEKKMIEQAKAGDPKAQFEMSQWARQMSILEPDEERWNRLAAKCLVDAAQAGYEPAKAMVQQLISGQTEPAAVPEPEDATAALEDKTMRYVPASQQSSFFDDFESTQPQTASPERSFYDQAEEDDYVLPVDEQADYEQTEQGFMATVKKVAAVAKKGAMVASAAIGGLVATIRQKQKDASARERTAEGASGEGRRSASRSRQSGFSAWVEDNWSVVRIVCIVVCVVLAGLIILLLATPKQNEEPVETPAVAPTVAPTIAPTAEPFPNEATKQDISTTSTLLYRPGDSEASAYLTASTSMTVQAEVSTDDGENLRQGPSAGDYPNVIMRIPNGTRVTAYAQYKNADGVVWYLINSGGTWGWMYGNSLS